jgi:hypothetical protein
VDVMDEFTDRVTPELRVSTLFTFLDYVEHRLVAQHFEFVSPLLFQHPQFDVSRHFGTFRSPLPCDPANSLLFVYKD